MINAKSLNHSKRINSLKVNVKMAIMIDDTVSVPISVGEVGGFFDEYTLDAPLGDIAVINNGDTAQFVGSHRDSECLLYKNYGNAFASDFTHYLRLKINTPLTVTEGSVILYALTNQPATYYDLVYGPDCVRYSGDEIRGISLLYNYNQFEAGHRFFFTRHTAGAGAERVFFEQFNSDNWIFVKIQLIGTRIYIDFYYDEYINSIASGSVAMLTGVSLPYHEIAGRGQKSCEGSYWDPDAYVDMDITGMVL